MEDTIKKSISLREDIYQYALEETERMHGGNFSAFITFLISVHRYESSVKTTNTLDELYALEKPFDEKVTILEVRHKALLHSEKHLSAIEKICEHHMELVEDNHLSISEVAVKRLIKYLFNEHDKVRDDYRLSITM
ncbi:hypothetical protein ABES02_07435 [Neobacillus pocheonensis]|uniref:hypothetical protein n=1 Tax=Neobacillus pocheonensis TaxID=363869 RepID=UPI003D2E731D